LSRAFSARKVLDAVQPKGKAAALLGSPAALLVGLVALSRVLTLEIGALAFRFLPHAWVQNVPGYFVPASAYWSESLLGVWSHWDGYWYLSIATLGYIGRSVATAFFPLYPLVVRVFGGVGLSGIFVSLACFAGGSWLLYRLARREIGDVPGWSAVLALALFPSSFFFNAVYPEALVLLLSVASLYLLTEHRYGWAALLAGVASAASVDGLLLGLPILVALLRERRPWKEWLSLLLVPLGLLSYMAYLFARFGNALTFQVAQQHWGRSLAAPWSTASLAVQDFWRHLPQLGWHTLFATGEPLVVISNVWNLVFTLLGLALIYLCIRRLRPELWTYALVVVVLPLFYPSAGVPLMSAPRFLLSAWPIFLAAGLFLAEHPRWTRPLLWASVACGALFIALFATSHWVA